MDVNSWPWYYVGLWMVSIICLWEALKWALPRWLSNLERKLKER